MSNPIQTLFNLRVSNRKSGNKDPLHAVVAGDSTGNYLDPILRPGKVYVSGDRLTGWVNGPRTGLMVSPGLHVLLEYDEYGRYYISRVDGDAELNSGSDPNATSTPLRQSITQDMLETLRIIATGDDLTVGVKSWVAIVDRTAYQFSGGTVDLSGLIPDAGEMLYVCIFVSDDFSTLEAFASTPRSTTDTPLNIDDIQECIDQSSVGSTPVWAIPLYDDPDTISMADIQLGVDLRNLVNNTLSSGTGDVSGPGASTDRSIPTWDGVDGDALRNNVNTNIDSSGNITVNGYKMPSAQAATLSSDAFTATKSYAILTSESGTSDNLATITSSIGNGLLLIQAASGQTITVKNGTGNIFLNGGADFVLSGDKTLLLFYDGTNWSDIGAGGGAGGTVTSVGTGTGVAGGPITGSGTIIATPVFKIPARVVATTNITISAPGATIDGESMASGDRVLLTGQSTGSQNGLWIWNGAASAMTRPDDFAAASTVLAFFNIFVYIYDGSANYIGSLWRLTTTVAVTIDTTSQAWEQVAININTANAVTGVLPETNGGTGRTTGAATKALDNLASVAINTSLVSDTDVTDDLGSASIRWLKIFGQTHYGDAYCMRVRNGSGATAAANDIGYLDYDATYGTVYKTTTTASFPRVGAICAVLVGAADGSDIYVAQRGQVTIKYTSTAPNAGEYLTTSTVAGQALRSTTMKPEVFAVATTNGSGGTVAVTLYTQTSRIKLFDSNDCYRINSTSTTNFVATINGAPSSTSVVYNAPSAGNENAIVPASATQLLKARLWNTTRSTYRLITAVNTGTNTITTVSSTDTWASGDTITIESQTVTSGASFKFMELDFSQQSIIPGMARSLLTAISINDTAAATAFNSLHPYESYSGQKQANFQYAATTTANVFNNYSADISIISGVITMSVSAGGTGTATGILRLLGYELAVP